jgi:two-component system, NarL family, sensor histidine kinase UhpB
MPIFWRILLTNLVVVLGGAVVGTQLTQRFVQRGEFTNAMHIAMVVVAIALSALVTWLGIHNAFRPLRELRRAIDRFNRGEGGTRVELKGGDPDTIEVARAVNVLWDQLERTNAVIGEQNRRLTALTAQVISAQEDERKRIARELHDEAGQALTALIIGLERGEQQMPGEHLARPRETVARLRDLAVQTLDEIRNLAHDLRPSLLDDLGLVAAIRWYARTCSARGGLTVEVDVDGLAEGDRLGSEVETTVFRIVQEGLTNVLKHAAAEHAWVRVRRDGRELVVEVEDDGRGVGAFDQDEGDRRGRLGLFGMVERARLLGGSIEIGPRTGGGTALRLIVPIAQREPVPA